MNFPSICPHCFKPVPANKRCACRPRRKVDEKARKQSEPWRPGYSEAEYQRERQEAMRRSGGRCVECGMQVARLRDGKWSIIRDPNQLGGTHHPQGGRERTDHKGLVLLCNRHHSKADTNRRREEI